MTDETYPKTLKKNDGYDVWKGDDGRMWLDLTAAGLVGKEPANIDEMVRRYNEHDDLQEKIAAAVLAIRFHGDEQCTDKQLIKELRAILADDIKKARGES